ncbi:SDR family NAD(P)-dependent oxidoreductase [Chloroflexota bacterium]
MKVDLAGRVAVVTGSSAGIGRVIALKLAENGADVAINGIGTEKGIEDGEKVVAEIEAMGRRAIFSPADITKYEEVQGMANTVIEKLGKIDIAIATGAAKAIPESQYPTFFRNTDPSTYMGYIITRWFTRAYVIRSVLEHMIERKYGKIVLVTTDAGRWPTPGESINGASAAAVVMMTKVTAKEFTRWGIRVNTVAITLTETSDEGYADLFSKDVSPVFRKAIERIPFGPNKAEDVAAGALFLASPDSDQITGQTLSINGGLSFPG